MVSIDIVRSTNAHTVQKQPLIAVFTGGTAGIGSFAVEALASNVGKHNGKGLRAYIVGRNQAATETIIADCKTVCPTGDFIFVKADDLSLLKDVDRVCAEITKAEEEASKKEGGGKARVDFLVMTQGILSFTPTDTTEGLDKTLSLMFYSRARVIIQLLPLLLASPLPAHIVSILNPNLEGKLVSSDFALRKKGNFTVSTGSSHGSQLNTLFMEQLAINYPSLAFIHQYPGFVMTNIGLGTLPTWFVLIWKYIIAPLIWPWTFTHEVSGERTVFLASEKFPARSEGKKGKTDNGLEFAVSPDGMVGGGMYRVDSLGGSIASGKVQRKALEEGMAEKVWEHTMEVFRTVEEGKVFKG